MRVLTLLLAVLAPSLAVAAIPGAKPGIVRVRIDTSDGPMILAVDTKRAPKTSANFLAYVDDGRLDGTSFYRAARSKKDPKTGFVQGGIQTDARRILPPFPLETTTMTGIKHLDATVSMARAANPDSAGGNFVITIGPAPQMDARPGFPGYAAFGHLIAGRETVQRILAEPSGGGLDAFKGQMILRKVRLIRARRLDGVAKPTGGPKVWLLMGK
ncbi:peptidylprolyl isomerase [Sphingomonas sp. PB2P19]|uniref:peptidylprolyl isomerase n=1 Tax=Sphingomonas rhamnosi TaxID=3096156 RepID=UPI002FC9850B